MSLLEQFPHRCTIYDTTVAGTKLGGSTETPVAVATDVPCWVQTASTGEKTDYHRRQQVVTHRVYFPADRSLSEDQTLVITDGETPALGKTLTVKDYAEASAGMGDVWKAMVEQEETD